MATFKISLNTTQTPPIIEVSGEIDLHTCPKLQHSLNEALLTGNTTLVLDLSNVPYIDSTGLGVVAHVARELLAKDGGIKVVSTNSTVLKIINLSGLTRKNITIFESVQHALANQ